MKRVLLRDSLKRKLKKESILAVKLKRLIIVSCFLPLALCTLRQGLSFQEPLCEAPLKGILLTVRDVLVLQQILHEFQIDPLVTRKQTLQEQERTMSEI